ncbi:MAG: 30S ribosomal protein S3 [Patescibacteria group bacterium]|nr:30S ribosomal protein S3 [Patescibacteria group bacterium]
MGHKIKPNSFRIGVTKDWNAKWFPKKRDFKTLLMEDVLIRKIIAGKINQAGIDSVIIERLGDSIRINIKAAKPGIIIGRGGKGIEDLSKLLEKEINLMRVSRKEKKFSGLSLNVEEIKRTDLSAAVIAQNIANDIERRMPFRRVIKKQLDQILQNKTVKGTKIRISGRLNGAEIARTESLAKGTIPLQTLRANIDYAEAIAKTTYGTIGVKVWINKGEVFKKDIISNKL